MIEAGDVLEIMPPKEKHPVTIQPNQRYSEPVRPTPPPAPVEPIKRRVKAAVPAKPKLHFALLLTLTYLLGPLAIVLTSRGRQEKYMVLAGGFSVAVTVALVLARFGGVVRADRPASAWLWLALTITAAICGFSAWARALSHVGREGVPHVNKLPHWLRRGSAISALGLVAPGSGLLLSGCGRRAATTLWLLWPAAAALVVLFNAMGLWRHHLASGWLAATGPALEFTFMIAAGIAAISFLGYIAQALEGMRQVVVEPGLKTRVKGDYYAVAVVAAVVVLAVVANPAQMAHQISVGGDVLREEGFQSIPLQLSLTASRLDPARPEYTLQAMELYAELGRAEKADELRAELDRNLGSYVAMVQKETVSEFGFAQARRQPAAKPRGGAALPPQPARAGVDPAATATGGLNAAHLHGVLLQQQAPAAVDSVSAATGRAGARAARSPLGLGMPDRETDAAAARRSAPQK
jgi:hypothetical protein